MRSSLLTHLASRKFLPYVVGPVALNLVPVVAELGGLGSYGFEIALFEFLSILCIAVAACIAWFTGLRQQLPALGVMVTTAVLTAYPCMRLAMPARRWAFAALAERSQPLVAAIETYSRKHGRPPASLAELVPNEIGRIPATGMPAYPAYEYSVIPGDSVSTLHWYDLGSRQGAPFQGLWKYPDGEKGHAILVIRTSRDGTVKDVALDRMARTVPALPFDEVVWRRDSSQRASMLADLRSRMPLSGQKFADLEAALGPASGKRTLSDTPWELRVACPRGRLNWDVFFYWPGRRYPAIGYGGSIERIRDWAYVHE